MALTTVGYIPKSAAAELEDIQDIFISVFGSGVNLSPSSINGVFIQELTNMGLQVEAAKTNLYAYLYDPAVSPGVWLDGLCKWNDIQRKPAVSSVVTCQVTGLAGTIIPIDSEIMNTNGDIFYNQIAITIGVGGTGEGDFYSRALGPIPCSAGTLTRIIRQLSGWDTVNNADSGIVGDFQQTDYSLRNTRRYSLGLNSTSTFSAMYSALTQTAGISDFFLLENYTNAPITDMGVTVSPHSIYLSVYGGTEEQIAAILYNKRSAGCGMDGDTIVPYTDSKWPWVTENMIYQTAVDTPCQINITFVDDPTHYPSDDIIKAAILANWNGQSNLPAVRMGVTIYSSRFYSTLADLGIATVITLTLQTVTGGTPSTSLTLPITQAPTLILADIIVNRS